MRIVFFGPPGVGKGTQGSRLSKALNIPVFATGDILRKAVREKTALGLSAKSFMDEGKFVPDDVVIGMIEARITAEEAKSGFILDGFPRNVLQAKNLDKMLIKQSINIDKVVFLVAEDKALVERLSGRLQCKACGFGFHRHYSPPRVDHICDQCGGELYQREDDQEEVIAQRLRVYQEQTQPLSAYYEHQDNFCLIDANGDPEQVYRTLTEWVSG
ncbi:MAG: adenylate kinase [Mariprofundaceae bacterium]|nr:adenylate kinase [Mariprofundaceae bacterium]